MDEYAEIQFIDGRNADHRTQQHPGTATRVPTRVFVPTGTRQPVQATFQPQVMYGPIPGRSTLLAGMSTGQLIDVVAQIFAALMPLPAQPVATTDASTDVQNLITYQGALASYAKRDEQIRTLGSLITKLVG